MPIHLPAVLSPQALMQARAWLADAEWASGRVSAGTQAAAVKNNEQVAAGCARLPALRGLVLAALRQHAPFFSAALPKKIVPPSFNRYGGAANTYGDHVDGAVRYGADHERVRTDLSCTLFLADPDEYDGGDLVVRDAFGERAYKLACGDALLYPGTSVHRVEAVTRGTRLASFFWIESMVRSHEQRRLLLDMDLALMRLRERDGESAEAVALTGVYHNLLRQWVDT